MEAAWCVAGLKWNEAGLAEMGHRWQDKPTTQGERLDKAATAESKDERGRLNAMGHGGGNPEVGRFEAEATSRGGSRRLSVAKVAVKVRPRRSWLGPEVAQKRPAVEGGSWPERGMATARCRGAS